ncbi:MAG: CcmD family protein [Gemmatimonadetes bacterium]|nr:CcmD family protein [Gemmatimonadota bacterium]
MSRRLRRTLGLFLPVFLLLLSPLSLVAQNQGRGALRPFAYVFVAYGLVWVIIGFWVFLIARRLGRLEERLGGGRGGESGE